jgi:sugar lactone lactonase YvrE
MNYGKELKETLDQQAQEFQEKYNPEPAETEAATEEATTEEATAEEETTEEAATEEETAEEQPAEETAAAEEEPENPLAKPLKQATLLTELPDKYNTPDGMCLLPDGNILVSVPNVNDDKYPAVLICVTPDNKVEEYYTVPLHPDTGRAFPFGVCVDPEGENLYLADLQWFADPENPNYKSRVLRIPLKDGKPATGDDGKPVEPEVVVEGMVVANAVIVRDGFLYVSDTLMVPGTDPVITGIYRIDLKEERPVKLAKPLEKDPHMIAEIPAINTTVGFGADGLTFDSKGNLYCGNFADGTLHKIEFDDEGNVKSNTICAKVPHMRCCDGIFCDLKTDEIYIADSLANAVQIYRPDGTVQTLAIDEENDGSGGRLDQPCEVLLRGREVIVSNMDFPIPTGVNTTFDKPYTLSIIKLDE